MFNATGGKAETDVRKQKQQQTKTNQDSENTIQPVVRLHYMTVTDCNADERERMGTSSVKRCGSGEQVKQVF